MQNEIQVVFRTLCYATLKNWQGDRMTLQVVGQNFNLNLGFLPHPLLSLRGLL